MKVAVCVKHVPGGNLRIDPASKRLDRSGPGELNSVGKHAIEERLPAVVAVSDSINVPRYTSLKGMMGAKKKPFDTVTVADLGIDASDAGDAGSTTEVLAVAEPPARLNARKVEDDGSAAQMIVEFLVEKELV